MSAPVIVTLTGPSCGGKSSLEAALHGRGFGAVVSHTTRPPRDGEVNGQHYHFVTPAVFQAMKDNSELVESAAFGSYQYGTSVESMRKALAGTGRIVIVLEPLGTAQLREYARNNGIYHCACWVSANADVRARRLVYRIPQMRQDQLAARLTLMLTDEVQWIRSATSGIIFSSPYRYNMEMWMAGPENEDIYIDAIARWADERQRPRVYAQGVDPTMGHAS